MSRAIPIFNVGYGAVPTLEQVNGSLHVMWHRTVLHKQHVEEELGNRLKHRVLHNPINICLIGHTLGRCNLTAVPMPWFPASVNECSTLVRVVLGFNPRNVAGSSSQGEPKTKRDKPRVLSRFVLHWPHPETNNELITYPHHRIHPMAAAGFARGRRNRTTIRCRPAPGRLNGQEPTNRCNCLWGTGLSDSYRPGAAADRRLDLPHPHHCHSLIDPLSWLPSTLAGRTVQR